VPINFYDESAKVLTEIDTATAGELVQAIARAYLFGEIPSLDHMKMAVYNLLKGQTDRAEELRLKQSNGGSKNKKKSLSSNIQTDCKSLASEDEKKQTHLEPRNLAEAKTLPQPNLTEPTETPVCPDGHTFPTGAKPKQTRFVAPSVELVAEYCTERKNGIDAEYFVDFYAAKGWKVGQTTMKDWKACVRTWEQRSGNVSPPSVTGSVNPFLRLAEQCREEECG
jgi:hypothetical protein